MYNKMYNKMPQYQHIGVSTELHLWLEVWVLLAALSVNFQGKYLFSKLDSHLPKKFIFICFNK